MQCSMGTLDNFLKTIRCKLKGHRFVASRTEPDVDVCVRCRIRVKAATPGNLTNMDQSPPKRRD